MIKAVFRYGAVQLLQPAPAEWEDGLELEIEPVTESSDNWTPEQIEAHYAELDALCSSNDPADEAIIRNAVEEQRRISKEQVRRDMENTR